MTSFNIGISPVERVRYDIYITPSISKVPSKRQLLPVSETPNYRRPFPIFLDFEERCLRGLWVRHPESTVLDHFTKTVVCAV